MSDFAVELRHVHKEFPDRRGSPGGVAAVRDVSLTLRPGEFFTLLGPSGCGKTTTLRMIAGFETPTRGELLIQGQPMTHVPPHRRPVNMVFQNYALFPHLNVLQNVAFGLAVKRVPGPEREKRARAALELVRLPALAERRPSELSGGQQQRVALARALVNQPAVLLLDEPLGALDLLLRKEMQIQLKHLQTQVGITFVYVTHDQEEALAMSDRIAVMSEGRVLQVDEPAALYEHPATRFVASFVGETNFLSATVIGNGGGTTEVSIGAASLPAVADPVGRLAVPTNGFRPSAGQSVTLAVRPERVRLAHAGQPAGEWALAGTVREAVYLGTDTRYVVGLPSGEKVVARLQNTSDHERGAFTAGEAVLVWCQPEDARLLAE